AVLQVRYKEDFEKMKGQSLFVPGAELIHSRNISAVISEIKYKGNVKTEISSSLYSLLPETTETQFVRELTEMQSEKSYKEKFNREKGRSDYSGMKTLPEVEHAMEVAKKQSHISYRKGREELHRYNPAPDRPDIISAANAAKLASDAGQPGNTQPPYTGPATPAGGAHLSVLQVKYKESFERHLKGQRPRYNPMDCVSFRHTQAAAALASQLEYKKKYEETKAHYHIAVDTAEQQHHRENAVLHSQVKYKEEYEKNKGRSLMEFGETQSYKVSKEAQKMQSEREYRRDFEEQVKGKALLEADQTPGFLTARNASSLLSEKEYRRDLETEIMGKGMELSADVLEIQRATRASQIQSQVPDHQELMGSQRSM
uniref:Nebulette n=1 Tax=Xiphophorus maculatus TaxID=8083 RepID=A0A3B5Q3H6_XIPMA